MEDFPNPSNSYLKAKDFQDNEISVTFLGWERKANEDLIKDGKVSMSWKDRLDFTLKYSFPEFAKDKAGDPVLDDQNQPLRNRNFRPEFPKGYSIVYKFNIGDLESGSQPLFDAFCRLKPKVGEHLVIMRTGEKTETEWHVMRAKPSTASGTLPERDINDFKHGSLEPDADVPF